MTDARLGPVGDTSPAPRGWGRTDAVPTLTALSIYPLKSCAELPLTHALAEPLGLRHDRRWMAVDEEGTFLTGRQVPALVHIRAVPGPTGLRLSAPDMPALEVPLPPPEAPRLTVSVWDDTCSAAHVAAGDAWLSRYLGRAVRLVSVDARMRRPVDPRYAGVEERVGFADGYPMLLLSEASLAELNQRLPRPVPMNRFRPNLVVGGCEPFAEDSWKRLRIGGVELAVVKPCARCVFVNLDMERGVSDPDREPLRTLATYRNRDHKVLFGQNVLVRTPGELRVGQPVEVLEAG